MHWDILRLWNDIQDGLAKVATQHGNEIAGIGIDTWGVDFGLLDANDQLLGNPVHYRDKRSDGMLEAATALVPRREIFESTGLQFLTINTLFQVVALKEQKSPQLDAARSFLMIPDLLNFWLTGRKATEYTIASTSQILDARTRQWDLKLLESLGLPGRIFTEIVSPGEKLATVEAEVAARTGFNPQTPVYAIGSHDTASAVVAVPAQGENWAYLSSGTWSLMGIEIPQPLINDRVAELNFTNEGGVADTIRLLKNIAGLWLVQECRRTWQRAGQEFDYAELTRLASEAPPALAHVEPDDASFVAPADMPQAIRDYCARTGQQPPEGVGATIRCCLESLALKYRWTMERLEELSGRRLDVLHIVGGGTQNKLLNQLTADCIGRDVVTGPVEATAAGNILTQAMAAGDIASLEELREVVRKSFPVDTYKPDPATPSQWQSNYEKYLRLLGG